MGVLGSLYCKARTHTNTRARTHIHIHTSSRLYHLIFLFFPWLFWLDDLGLQLICWCGQRWRWKKKHPLSCAWQPLPPNKYMLSRLPRTKGVCCQIRRLKFSTPAKSMFCFVRKYRTDILPCDICAYVVWMRGCGACVDWILFISHNHCCVLLLNPSRVHVWNLKEMLLSLSRSLRDV